MTGPNIAFVCDAINNFTAGSFVSPLRFSELLEKKGHRVIFISSKNLVNPKIDYFGKVKIYRLPSFAVPKTDKKLYFAYPNKKLIKNILLKEKIDIVHFMVPTPLAISSISAARELGLKVLAYSHTQPENWATYFPKFIKRSGISKKFISLAYKYILAVYNRADGVVCPSRFSEQLLRSKNIKIKSFVVSNGVDKEKFKKVQLNDFYKKFNLLKNSKKILYLGRLDPEKNIKLLVKAARFIKEKHGNFEVLIAGDGAIKNDLMKLAEETGVRDKVHFLGRVSDEDRLKLYNLCDFFVLPSFVELEGMVVLEAMSCGKAVLIANSPNSASRYFVHGNGFLFNPFSEEDLSEKALLLLNNEKLLREFSKQSYVYSKNFDINKSIENLEKIYFSYLS